MAHILPWSAASLYCSSQISKHPTRKNPVVSDLVNGTINRYSVSTGETRIVTELLVLTIILAMESLYGVAVL
jgi:hypothetical protein